MRALVAVVAVVAGAAAAGTGALIAFVGSGWILVPWAVIGLALGATCRTRREAIATAALYGFTLAFTFMIIGYSGTASRISRLPFFTVMGLVGAGCGAALGALAATVLNRNGKHRGIPSPPSASQHLDQ